MVDKCDHVRLAEIIPLAYHYVSLSEKKDYLFYVLQTLLIKWLQRTCHA